MSRVLPLAGRGQLYRLRKWYCDLLTPAMEYCFIYYAEARIAGATFRACTLHRARPGGEPPVTRQIPVSYPEDVTESGTARTVWFEGGRFLFSEEESTIDAACPGALVHLRLTRRSGDGLRPVEIRGKGPGHILWVPLQLKSRVTGSVAIDGLVTDVKGCDGYIDFLESTSLPPIVPVRRLRWGRLHHPSLDLAFMRGEDTDGTRSWSMMIVNAGGVTYEFDDLVCEPSGEGAYELRASRGSSRLWMQVRQTAIVQQGRFVDQSGIASSLLRAAVRWGTRDPRSTKWLSGADVRLEARGRIIRLRNVPLIDEWASL